MQRIAVKAVIQGNKPYPIQRKDALHKISDLNAVAPKTGKVLDDDAVDRALAYLVQKFLHGGPFKVCPAVTVVYKFQYLRMGGILHRIGVLVKRPLLVLNAETPHLAVLGGKPDIKANHIGFIHLPAPPSAAQSRSQI